VSNRKLDSSHYLRSSPRLAAKILSNFDEKRFARGFFRSASTQNDIRAYSCGQAMVVADHDDAMCRPKVCIWNIISFLTSVDFASVARQDWHRIGTK